MHPDWVLKHKAKGTNISRIRGKYYLYEVGSVWSKEKGRAQKVTKRYLGRITEEGVIAPKEKSAKIVAPVSVKEFGAAAVVAELGKDILQKLEEKFPKEARTVFALAAMRVVEPNPFKRAQMQYRNSYLSELLPDLKLSGKDISLFLREFGGRREEMARFMRGFIGEGAHLLFDGTGIVSQSEKMGVNRVGYNAHRDYRPQINLLYAFAHGSRMPSYYRVVAGNVRDVGAFKLCLEEARLKDMTVVADKGFGSKENFDLMEAGGIKYVVPLRRNSSLFDSAKLEKGDKGAFDGYFLFNGRPIWHYKTPGAIVYLDNDLRNEEEKDCILRIEKQLEGYTKDELLARQFKFGAIILRTNIQKTAEEVYAIYKERGEIEQAFDFLKNLLEQDKTHMQNEKSLEAWAFINHIALMLHYKIYNLLREKGLLSKFSVADFLSHLKYIFKIKAGPQWLTSEISTKTADLLEALGVSIT